MTTFERGLREAGFTGTTTDFYLILSAHLATAHPERSYEWLAREPALAKKFCDFIRHALHLPTAPNRLIMGGLENGRKQSRARGARRCTGFAGDLRAAGYGETTIRFYQCVCEIFAATHTGRTYEWLARDPDLALEFCALVRDSLELNQLPDRLIMGGLENGRKRCVKLQT